MIGKSSGTDQSANLEKSTRHSSVADNDCLRSEGGTVDSKPTDSGKKAVRRISVNARLDRLKEPSSREKNETSPVPPSFKVQSVVTAPKRILSENLMILLKRGSQDSLNFMIEVFEFHQFDQSLLNNYLANKNADNLKALEIQIQNLAVSSVTATSDSSTNSAPMPEADA